MMIARVEFRNVFGSSFSSKSSKHPSQSTISTSGRSDRTALSGTVATAVVRPVRWLLELAPRPPWCSQINVCVVFPWRPEMWVFAVSPKEKENAWRYNWFWTHK